VNELINLETTGISDLVLKIAKINELEELQWKTEVKSCGKPSRGIIK
jgi:hypothetical protein